MKCYLKITRSGPSCSCSPSCRRACIRRRIQSCTWSQFAAKTATFLTYLILTSTNTFYSSQKRQTVRQKDQVKALKCISICKEHFESLKKYHCTAGLQFYKFFFSCFTAYKNKIFSLLVKSSFTSFYSVALLHTKIRYFLRWSSPVLQDFIQLLYCIQKQDIFFVGQVQSC